LLGGVPLGDVVPEALGLEVAECVEPEVDGLANLAVSERLGAGGTVAVALFVELCSG
jgi:hypothetical protein